MKSSGFIYNATIFSNVAVNAPGVRSLSTFGTSASRELFVQ